MDIMEFGITQVAAITVICYLIGTAIKAVGKIDKFIPTIVGFVGALLGVVAWKVMPEFVATSILDAIAIGIVSGLSSTGVNQLVKQLAKEDNNENID